MGKDARTIVYLGPTLSPDEARALLPGAELRPPVAMGDVYRLVRPGRGRPPARIAIIDGLFEQVPAVWHKELLYAMERGVEVSGAASMGALRAAELHAFGMIGVGTVFAGYRSGRLADDDEVAVAHGPARLGYPRFSEALVNVRDALARARRAGLISGESHDRLLELARSQFYRERTWQSIIDAGREARLPARQLRALAAWIVRVQPDRKATDARLLLRRLGRTRPARPRLPEPLARTWFWQQLTELAPLGDLVDRDS
jgi:hypothetical protein